MLDVLKSTKQRFQNKSKTGIKINKSTLQKKLDELDKLVLNLEDEDESGEDSNASAIEADDEVDETLE